MQQQIKQLPKQHQPQPQQQQQHQNLQQHQIKLEIAWQMVIAMDRIH